MLHNKTAAFNYFSRVLSKGWTEDAYELGRIIYTFRNELDPITNIFPKESDEHFDFVVLTHGLTLTDLRAHLDGLLGITGKSADKMEPVARYLAERFAWYFDSKVSTPDELIYALDVMLAYYKKNGNV